MGVTCIEFENLWDVKRASEYLNMSVSWVYAACVREDLPHVHVGKALRFEPQALREYVRGERGGTVVRLPGRMAA